MKAAIAILIVLMAVLSQEPHDQIGNIIWSLCLIGAIGMAAVFGMLLTAAILTATMEDF